MRQPTPAAGEGGPPEGKQVFRLLAGDGGNNVVGFVAYCLYRRSKLEWEKAIRETKGRPPDADDMIAFDRTVTDTNLETYQNEARSVLAEFAESAVNDAMPEIVSRVTRGRFWWGVLASMVGSALFAVVLLVLVIIATRSDIDLRAIFVGQ